MIFGSHAAAEIRLSLEGGDGGEGHGDRTAVPGLDLRLNVGPRRARDMGAFARVGPRRGMNPRFDRRLHQRVIAGVKPHQIDAPPVAVVGVEFGRILVGERALLENLRRAGARPEHREAVRSPGRAFALDRLLQRRIRVEQVAIGQLDRLVKNLVGDRAVRVERRAEIVLSVMRQGAHGGNPLFSAGYNGNLFAGRLGGRDGHRESC